jgi:hypothetical protein
VISGSFFVEIKYNDTIKELIEYTKKTIKEEKEEARRKKRPFKNYEHLLKVELSFQRDFTIPLNFEEGGEDDDDIQSEGSEWSIIDRTWDLTFEDDKEHQMYKFKLWKCFNA